MKKTMTLICLLLSVLTVQAKKVPLEAFAQKSQFLNMRISPDGKHIAYTYEEGNQVKLGTMNLKTKKGIHSFDVGEDREIIHFSWVNNERLFFAGGNITGWLDGANKDYRAYFANLDGKKRKGVPLGYTNIVSDLEESPDEVLILKNFGSDGVKLHKMNINTLKTVYQDVEPKTIGGMHSRVNGIYLDNDNIARVAREIDPVDLDDYDDNVMYIHIREQKGEWELLKLKNQRNDPPGFAVYGFSKDNSKVYFISNFDLPDEGPYGLFQYDFNTKQVSLIYRHPDVDVGAMLYTPDDILMGIYIEPGYPDYVYIENEHTAPHIAFHKGLRASFKGSQVSVLNRTEDKQKSIIYVRSDKNPGDFYIYDSQNKKIEYLASSMPSINPKDMAAVEPFTMEARDGLKMYGQLTIPPNKELKNLPMVVYPHGGPYGVKDRWGWLPRPQMLANNGYLVLQLNFRGSGGYGESFEEAGHHEWGAKMQDDITDATHWAINQGYADKERICIHGISYGGYASLQAVVREPDLYKCAIPDAGPYELDYQLRKADSFKANSKRRKWFFDRMLGPDYEQLNRERSPAYHVDKIKAGIFIVHGKKDKRVPIGNAYLLEDKLKEKGIKYQTMYKKDGHGFMKVEYSVELYEAMLKFLKKHIGK